MENLQIGVDGLVDGSSDSKSFRKLSVVAGIIALQVFSAGCVIGGKSAKSVRMEEQKCEEVVNDLSKENEEARSRCLALIRYSVQNKCRNLGYEETTVQNVDAKVKCAKGEKPQDQPSNSISVVSWD